MIRKEYKAIISSDWNQCLAPCGPFDPIIFHYPKLASELTKIFLEYTRNIISLGTANKKILKRLPPEPISISEMDEYLDDRFATYKGVSDLIAWCEANNILFMLNTTGLVGYFQRVFAKYLLPRVPVLSGNPMIKYHDSGTDPAQMYTLNEIDDKGKNTARAMEAYAISGKIVIIGDSGGDGPHFEWGQNHEAYLVGSMAKDSLKRYCNRKHIEINLLFGETYHKGEQIVAEKEMRVNFIELSAVFEKVIGI